jgi:uncharacterized protein (TIGR02145 family)
MSTQNKIHYLPLIPVLVLLVLIMASCDKYLPADEPMVGTSEVTGITQTTANGGGSVTGFTMNGLELPILSNGLVWSTDDKPTVKKNEGMIINWEGDGTDKYAGTGTFGCTMTGLTPGTKYYVRAYAENKNGVGYGVTQVFMTLGDSGNSCPPTVTDKEGNTYGTTLIGFQCWMKENLKTTAYRDGTPVQSTGYFWYEDKIAWKDSYGALYNYQAVTSAKGLCPEGWHIPSAEEWKVLTDYLGGAEVAGGKMKSDRTAPELHPRWDSPNTGAAGNDGFAALPGGYRYIDNDYYDLGKAGLFYSSSAYDSDYAWIIMVESGYREAGVHTMLKSYGCSVRCIRD